MELWQLLELKRDLDPLPYLPHESHWNVSKWKTTPCRVMSCLSIVSIDSSLHRHASSLNFCFNSYLSIEFSHIFFAHLSTVCWLVGLDLCGTPGTPTREATKKPLSISNRRSRSGPVTPTPPVTWPKLWSPSPNSELLDTCVVLFPPAASDNHPSSIPF